MRLGIVLPIAVGEPAGDVVSQGARAAEEHGLDSVWFFDSIGRRAHVAGPAHRCVRCGGSHRAHRGRHRHPAGAAASPGGAGAARPYGSASLRGAAATGRGLRFHQGRLRGGSAELRRPHGAVGERARHDATSMGRRDRGGRTAVAFRRREGRAAGAHRELGRASLDRRGGQGVRRLDRVRVLLRGSTPSTAASNATGRPGASAPSLRTYRSTSRRQRYRWRTRTTRSICGAPPRKRSRGFGSWRMRVSTTRLSSTVAPARQTSQPSAPSSPNRSRSPLEHEIVSKSTQAPPALSFRLPLPHLLFAASSHLTRMRLSDPSRAMVKSLTPVGLSGRETAILESSGDHAACAPYSAHITRKSDPSTLTTINGLRCTLISDPSRDHDNHLPRWYSSFRIHPPNRCPPTCTTGYAEAAWGIDTISRRSEPSGRIVAIVSAPSSFWMKAIRELSGDHAGRLAVSGRRTGSKPFSISKTKITLGHFISGFISGGCRAEQSNPRKAMYRPSGDHTKGSWFTTCVVASSLLCHTFGSQSMNRKSDPSSFIVWRVVRPSMARNPLLL